MKKNILTLLLFLSVSSIFAQIPFAPLKWYTIEEAEKLNATTPRKIMIDLYTDWCGWCKRMDSETFQHPDISKILVQYYYPVKFNAESTAPLVFQGKTYINENPTAQRSSHQYAVTLLKGQMSYPSIFYYNEKLEPLGAVPGYKTPNQMEIILMYIATDKFKVQSMEDFQKTFVSKLNPAKK